MIDFSSSLYLGLNHPYHQLKKWDKISLGKPAILKEVPSSISIGKQLGSLQGLTDGILGPSTFHLFWDFFNGLSPKKYIIYYDEGIYPIAKWGIEYVRCKGLAVRPFRHFDAEQLSALLAKDKKLNKRPVIVSDSWCMTCSSPFPLGEYSHLAKVFGGFLVIDDSQTFGLFGAFPTKLFPYGIGGGGILKWFNLQGNHLITINSLAKAFGVPIACISGSTECIKSYKRKSQIRIYNSPPAFPMVNAVHNAIQINQYRGDILRKRLFDRVIYLRKALHILGINVYGGFFPVQKISFKSLLSKNHPYLIFKKEGLWTVPVASKGDPQVGLILRANISKPYLEKGIGKIKQIIQENKNSYAKSRYFFSR